MSTIALDVGGSSIKSGLVGDDLAAIGDVSVTAVVHTAPADVVVHRFAMAIRAGAADGGGAAPRRIAIAVPDPFDHERGVSLMEHKFAALHGIPLAEALLADLAESDPAESAPAIRWCNDAAAAVTGEALAGAGAGCSRVLGLTLGTGLGAALVVDGAVSVQAGGVIIGDLWRRPTATGAPADVAFAAGALLAVLESDPVDGGARFGAELGELLAPVVEAVGAEIVVVGGGGAGSFERFAPALRAAIRVPCAPAELGHWAALIGAAHLCFGSRR